MVSEGDSLQLSEFQNLLILVYDFIFKAFSYALLQLINMIPFAAFIAKALKWLKEVLLIVYITKTLIPDPGFCSTPTRVTCMMAPPFSVTFTKKPFLRLRGEWGLRKLLVCLLILYRRKRNPREPRPFVSEKATLLMLRKGKNHQNVPILMLKVIKTLEMDSRLAVSSSFTPTVG